MATDTTVTELDTAVTELSKTLVISEEAVTERCCVEKVVFKIICKSVHF